jgi:serine protease Do
MKKQFFLQLVLFLLLLPGLAACSSVTAPLQSMLPNQATLPAVVTSPSPDTSVTTAPALPQNEAVAAIEGSLENIYTQVNPSVVSIQVTQKQEVPAMPQLPGFRFFFGPQTPQSQAPQEYYSHGAGSGFVWDKQGHIVTNNHVVDGADKITVTFADETTASAEVVGTDPDSDLAVLKVDLPAAQLKPVEVGDSTQVKVGQLAVAIGNPFGLENTMTVGFVSALERLLPVSSSASAQGPTYTIPDIIQTDAPINPGNSGGVLVNDQGQVIGVTAAIESPVRASAGVGFAIPSAIVQKAVPALIKDGHYQHSWLGLSGTSLTPELAQAMNLKANQHGALVVDVTPGGPADKAGLRGSDRQMTIEDQQVPVGGDVIVAIDKQPVKNFDDLVAYLVRATEVNQTVTLTVLRQGKEETVKATLAARPKSITETQQPEKVIASGPHLGIEGLTLTPEIAKAMDLAADQQGVLVENVQLGSPADQAHLNGSYKAAMINGRQIAVGGDVITAVDNQPVTSLEDLQNFMQQTKSGQALTLAVLRDGKQVKVKVTLE